MKLICFGIWKDLLGADLTWSPEEFSWGELRTFLSNKAEGQEALINQTRFAIESAILSDEDEFPKEGVLYILPPSSGG